MEAVAIGRQEWDSRGCHPSSGLVGCEQQFSRCLSVMEGLGAVPLDGSNLLDGDGSIGALEGGLGALDVELGLTNTSQLTLMEGRLATAREGHVDGTSDFSGV